MYNLKTNIKNCLELVQYNQQSGVDKLLPMKCMNFKFGNNSIGVGQFEQMSVTFKQEKFFSEWITLTIQTDGDFLNGWSNPPEQMEMFF